MQGGIIFEGTTGEGGGIATLQADYSCVSQGPARACKRKYMGQPGQPPTPSQ